jgi:hypothetical protein
MPIHMPARTAASRTRPWTLPLIVPQPSAVARGEPAAPHGGEPRRAVVERDAEPGGDQQDRRPTAADGDRRRHRQHHQHARGDVHRAPVPDPRILVRPSLTALVGPVPTSGFAPSGGRPAPRVA